MNLLGKIKLMQSVKNKSLLKKLVFIKNTKMISYNKLLNGPVVQI
ncbi:hypothetical protein ECDEC13E_3055 [Escherichia coli DEC13E]|nr:hypothetical protein ECDEC13E_3055 [Escherichia coli DEC13E]